MHVDISVIIPVYNSEKFLRVCLESVINQSLKNIEIIIINDGSEDNSEKIIFEFLTKDNRIKYIKHKNKGVSYTRNIGIREANGEYISFIDSDDIIEKEMLQQMFLNAKKSNSDIVRCGYKKITANDDILYEFKEKEQIIKGKEKIELLTRKLDMKFTWFVVRHIYSKKLLQYKKIFFNESIRYGEDSLFNIEVFFFANQISCVENSYYKYVLNSESVTSKMYKKNLIDIFVNQEQEKINLYKKLGIYNLVIDKLRLRFNMYLIYLIIINIYQNNGDFIANIKKINNNKFIKNYNISILEVLKCSNYKKGIKFIIIFFKLKQYKILKKYLKKIESKELN